MWYVLFVFYEVDEDIVTFTIGDDDTDALLLHLLGGGVLRMHTATTKGTLLRFDILREVYARQHFGDDLRPCIIGVTVVYAVDIA